MVGGRTPKYIVLAAMLGVAAAIIVLSISINQYRWLESAAKHNELLQSNFEQDSKAEIEKLGNQVSSEYDASDSSLTIDSLNNALASSHSLNGLRFVAEGLDTVLVGNFPAGDPGNQTTWLERDLLVSYTIVSIGRVQGTLTGAFALDQLHSESEAFAAGLLAREVQNRRASYVWIGIATLATLLLCGATVWLLSHNQSMRIRQLQRQAEKLRNSDFGEPLPQSQGDALGDLASVFNDMRDRLQKTTISRDYVDSLLSGMNEAIVVTSSEGSIKRVNKATTLLLGYEEDELIGNSIDFLVSKGKAGALADGGPSGMPKDSFFESKYGESIPVSYTCSFVDGEDGITEDQIYAAQNTSEKRRAEQRIRYLARIDALTKVPNRMQFQHLLQRSIARARRASKPLCLFYIDVDHFKDINDTFGHLAGDATLETVTERLAAALPNESIIGRLAGDEFAVIVDNLGPEGADFATTEKLARHVLDRLADPFFVQGNEVFMTASMGIAYYPQDAPNVIDLIRNADAALYHSKKTGGNVFSFYVPEMNEAAVERLMTKSKLKRAFERDELLVHYQPKYNLVTGEVFGAEALVRWQLPERGLILPSDFIPIAEETNLIIEIGEWVLDKVCEDIRIWQRSVSSPGRVSVNLSLKQLRQANFINRINSVLRGHGVSPTSLELEITETTLMENPERTINLLNQLYALGLNLAIDDFGTGYSSLSALQQFPISTLKIDQSFVRDVAINPDDATIVGTIVQMGRNLHMDVVAEGVENEDQLSFLRKLDCTYVQGLLFGNPMSSDNYLELLLAQAEGTNVHRALFA
jgi:diguanylate cyclase (GGDEF)-like protein/PAS domain S-box-containing protein